MRTRGWWLAAVLAALLLAVGVPVRAQGGTSTALGTDYVLPPGETLHEDLMIVGGSAVLHPGSVVAGNVTALGGETTIQGRVYGDVVAIGGVTRLTATAVVDGDLVAFGSVERERGATVHGNVIEGTDAFRRVGDLRPPPGAPAVPGAPVAPERPEPPRTPGVVRWAVEIGRRVTALLFSLGVAALLAALFPAALSRTADVMRTSWPLSLGMGVLTAVLAALLAVIFGLLSLICLGIPLLLVLGVALLAAVILGWVAAGRLIGQSLGAALHLTGGSLLVETVLGTGALGLVAMVPCVGPVVALVALTWGLGAAVVANVGALQSLSSSPFSGSPPSGGPGTTGPNDLPAAESQP